MADSRIVSFTGDDFRIRRMVNSKTDLPLNRYTSLGAILENDRMKKAFEDAPFPVISTKKDTLHRKYVLGPLSPGKATVQSSEDPLKEEDVPQAFDEAGQLQGYDPDQPIPPHDGVIWPMKWARRPPYATPGYNRVGVRQPIGVVQVDRVPSKPSRGFTESGEYDLPTWVSPLYRSYGVGGPFGPFGPFYEPPNFNKPPSHLAEELTRRPPKKCFLKRLLSGREADKAIENTDKNMVDFLKFLDENLIAMRRVLRIKKNNREMMVTIVGSLSHILDDTQKFADKVQGVSPPVLKAVVKNDSSNVTTGSVSTDGNISNIGSGSDTELDEAS